MTLAGLPHSEICGSKAALRLPAAFRSLPRPSSPPDAKASTVCPLQLDQKSSSCRTTRARSSRVMPKHCKAVSVPKRRSAKARAGRPAWTQKAIRLSKTSRLGPLAGAGLSWADGSSKEPSRTKCGEPLGGADRDRTDDLRLAKPALSQLSYSPWRFRRLVGLRGFEPRTFRLSGGCSNQLSYRPRFCRHPRSLRYAPAVENSPPSNDRSKPVLEKRK